MSESGRRPLVVITDDRFGDQAIERAVLEPSGCELVVAACRSEEDVALACAEADAVLANMAPIGPLALAGMRRCKVVSRYGIGLDNVDLAKAKDLGIEVRNVPGYCDDEVAEHALALMFDLARSTWGRNKAVREGRWNLKPATPRIAGSVLGIVGFGGSARALARRALGLGFARILVWSPHLSEARLDDALSDWKSPNSSPVLEAGFDELFMDSDFVSLHLKLTPETRGLVDERTLALMKRGARLVNVARGGLVDERALVAALDSGMLAGAGLDVFATEPLPPSSPLIHREDVVLTDHAAWFSDVSVGELRRRCAQNALEVLLSEPERIREREGTDQRRATLRTETGRPSAS